MGRVFKIVVTGPFNSGKTTFIGAISEIEVVTTERVTGKGSKKALTTVAMDFGRITLPDGYVIHLYGTPGQDRFDFMWEILSEGMLGYVMLLDGTRPADFAEGKKILKAFEHISDSPYVVGLTRADKTDCLAPEQIRRDIGLDKGVGILRCDARKLEDVKNVLIEMLERVVERAEAIDRAG